MPFTPSIKKRTKVEKGKKNSLSALLRYYTEETVV
jgi:hypothetical protein